jgi:hypothetical protein
MIRHLVISWISGATFLAAAESSDLLRFSNGDQLHGQFQGIQAGPQAVWRHDDVSAPVDFKTSQLRHVVLRGGRPMKPLSSLSHVALVNGDRLPGKITGMDAETIILETSYAGVLKIPREQVAMLAPSPLGGRLQYHGPFLEDEWKMSNASYPDGMPSVTPDPEGKAKDDRDLPGRWIFSGSAWYWPGKRSGTALLRENAMPDRSILRFDLAWKSRLAIAIGFHADFVKPKLAEEVNHDAQIQRRGPLKFAPGDSTILPMVFGNSYVLQIFSTHMMLFRTTVNEDGGPSVERVQINGNSIRLGDTGKATLEIRSNRRTGEISLFINEEFVVQWSEGAAGPRDSGSYAGKGNGFGFVVQTEDSSVKISDVMVGEWNGMPDSARSLQVDEQDIVLLANGTDRFSGKVDSFSDGKLSLSGKYGRFQIQLDDIAEIRFARNRLAKEAGAAADNLTIKFSPLGRISGRPLAGTAGSIRLLHPVCGEIDLKLESAVMLDFKPSTNLIDDWDAEF